MTWRPGDPIPSDAEVYAVMEAAAQAAEAAQVARIAQDGNRGTLADRALTAYTANNTFLALASPTNAQTLAQVKALTRQMNALARVVFDRLDSTDGT